ncbi:MAG: hypothetical protein KJ638_05410, partial [Chloroflexi bacterium]|nr:hypothetical protein [Chloroflexota bacterium]
VRLFGHLHRISSPYGDCVPWHRPPGQVWCSAGVAAHSVQRSDCVFGALYRRLRARLGPAQATVATAHALARVVYRMLTLAPHIIPVWGLRSLAPPARAGVVQCR